MNNGNNIGWDLTVAAAGEMEDYDYNTMMEELYSDPEFRAYLDARNAEALEYQMAQDAIEHQND
jgi:cobalamin biosynthesis Mg chelatase CobN